MEELLNVLREIIVPGATALTGYGIHYLKSRNDRRREEHELIIQEQKVKNDLRQIIIKLEDEINEMYLRHAEEVKQYQRDRSDFTGKIDCLRAQIKDLQKK